MADVEKVARAICRAHTKSRTPSVEDVDGQVNTYWGLWVPEAEAALAAMGEREADKITQDEVAAMFGPYMPIEAALLIDRWTGTTTGLRQALAKMAASPRPEAVEDVAKGSAPWEF